MRIALSLNIKTSYKWYLCFIISVANIKKHLKNGIENFLAVLAKAYLFLCIYVINFWIWEANSEKCCGQIKYN